MPKLTIYSWNIQNWGDRKFVAKQGKDELVDFVARVIARQHVAGAAPAAITGICEIRSDLGKQIGAALVKRLDVLFKAKTSRFAYAASQQLVKKRWEQYLFIWDTTQVTTIGAASSAFTVLYPKPAGAKGNIGFPRQKDSDRPPYSGQFRSADNKLQIPVAMFHAPEPSYWPYVKEGCQALADVDLFKVATQACVVMGDFNVKYDANAYNGNKGVDAFGDLVTAGFAQTLPGNGKKGSGSVYTTLMGANQATPKMTTNECFSQPYDNFFLRPNGTKGTLVDSGVENLLEDCIGKSSVLGKSLCALQKAVSGTSPKWYVDAYSVFPPFRKYVSDHMPVSLDVQW